ncbi:MAG: hypothetical protein H0X08_02555 [Blastocatellia bacterium]|nr:hypothetical protein [Blastocatellia bacterium]
MSLSAHIKIDKDLAVKGYRRALRYGAFGTYLYWYAIRLTVLWVLIAMADGIGGEKDLAPLHAGVLLLVCLGATIYDYIQWYRGIETTITGWEFDATLDEDGVKTHTEVPSDAEYSWDFYTGYREYDDYLEIHDSNKQVTFVPKTVVLAEVVAITKEKIPKL